MRCGLCGVWIMTSSKHTAQRQRVEIFLVKVSRVRRGAQTVRRHERFGGRACCTRPCISRAGVQDASPLQLIAGSGLGVGLGVGLGDVILAIAVALRAASSCARGGGGISARRPEIKCHAVDVDIMRSMRRCRLCTSDDCSTDHCHCGLLLIILIPQRLRAGRCVGPVRDTVLYYRQQSYIIVRIVWLVQRRVSSGVGRGGEFGRWGVYRPVSATWPQRDRVALDARRREREPTRVKTLLAASR